MSFSSSSSGTATPTPAGTEVPLVGYRFHPTDRELIINYLGPKNRGQDDHDPFIADVEVCKIEPWDLPVRSMIRSDDQVWYFYCRRELKFNKSNRSNRTTKEGYWKPDGKARPIKAKRTKKVIGSKRTLVFHHGRPKGMRTKWVMHEYACSPDSGLSNQGDFVMCKLKDKSDENDTKRDAYHQTALNPEIESQELAKMASLSSHEPSHLMLSGSYNKNQDLCITAAWRELVDANSVESSPTFDSNMGLLSMTNHLPTSSQKVSPPPKTTMPNSHTQIYPRLPASNTSTCHYQNNDIVEVVFSQLSSQTPKKTLQTSNIPNSDSLQAIKTSLCHYQNNDINEVALSQQSSQTPKTIPQTSNIQTFNSLPAINSSLCHYLNNGIFEVTSFDPKTQANVNSKIFDSFQCDASDGGSISPSQSAILSAIVVNSTNDVADSLMVPDLKNQNLDNQDGTSSASVDEEPEKNSEFSSEFLALLDMVLEQDYFVKSPLWMPFHSDEGPSSMLFPPECDSTLRPSPLCL